MKNKHMKSTVASKGNMVMVFVLAIVFFSGFVFFFFVEIRSLEEANCICVTQALRRTLQLLTLK